jgi:uncharacterized protein YlzI (FlbEa/FlbD family)
MKSKKLRKVNKTLLNMIKGNSFIILSKINRIFVKVNSFKNTQTMTKSVRLAAVNMTDR